MECKIQYLSPTSLSTFEKSPDQFVLTYVHGVPRNPQLKVMAVGSAFDAYVKGALAEEVMGLRGVAQELMATQVSDQWRLEVNSHAKHLLAQYRSSGAYKKLLTEIGDSRIAYEFDAKKVLDIDGLPVPVAGKPDLYFRRAYLRTGETGDGGEEYFIKVILDWKVTGFFSKASPEPGYSRLLDAKGNDRGPHKDCMVQRRHGFDIGIGGAIKTEWETQITMYTWCLEDDITDDEWILAIDQIVLANLTGKFVGLQGQTFKVASYRKIRKENSSLRERLKKAWMAIQNQHYFQDMTKEESDARVELLGQDDQLRWAILGG